MSNAELPMMSVEVGGMWQTAENTESAKDVTCLAERGQPRITLIARMGGRGPRMGRTHGWETLTDRCSAIPGTIGEGEEWDYDW